MKKKLLTIILASILTMSLTACGNSEQPEEKEIEISDTEDEPEDDEVVSEDSTDTALDALGDVEVDEKLFSVELTIPAEYVGETTQEELNQTAEENGFKSITLNEDGSATYIMTKAQHEEMINEMAATFYSALDEMVGSEEYPNITDITANSDFTEFTVTTTSTELDLNESLSVIVFYTYGGMYGIFNGTTVENVHVDFVNANSGEIINSSNSSDMATTE